MSWQLNPPILLYHVVFLRSPHKTPILFISTTQINMVPHETNSISIAPPSYQPRFSGNYLAGHIYQQTTMRDIILTGEERGSVLVPTYYVDVCVVNLDQFWGSDVCLFVLEKGFSGHQVFTLLVHVEVSPWEKAWFKHLNTAFVSQEAKAFWLE